MGEELAKNVEERGSLEWHNACYYQQYLVTGDSAMNERGKQYEAEKMAELTFQLLEQCQQKQEQIAGNLGLTIAEFKLMRAFRQDRKLSTGELGRRVKLSSSRITRILDGLVKKEIVTREAAADDRRVINITLTHRGLSVQQELSDRFVRTHEDILDHLPPGAGTSVITSLEKLGEAMEQWQRGTGGSSRLFSQIDQGDGSES